MFDYLNENMVSEEGNGGHSIKEKWKRSGEGYQTEKKGRDKEGKMKIVGKHRLFKKSDFINMYVWQRLKGQQDLSKAWVVGLFIYFLLGGEKWEAKKEN